MAKKNRGDAPEGDAAAVAEEKVDGRYKKLTDPSTGQVVNRVEYIRYLCKSVAEGGRGMTRSAARDEIEKITGEKIRYQIVFAATKGMAVAAAERGKKKEEAAAEATA